jgi:hypothetical protein
MTQERSEVEVLSDINDEIASAERTALRAVNAYLDSDGDNPSLLRRAQVAQSLFGSIQRRRATDNARDALTFAIARSITRDPTELARYIKITQPRSPLVDAISDGKV